MDVVKLLEVQKALLSEEGEGWARKVMNIQTNPEQGIEDTCLIYAFQALGAKPDASVSELVGDATNQVFMDYGWVKA